MNSKTTFNEYPFSLRGFNLTSSLLAILNYSEESDVDYTLASYFIENMKVLDKLSIYDVAEDCFVSRSTVQRFVKHIGFDSFKQMKENVKPLRVHSKAFIEFADQTSFRDYIGASMNEMIHDINSTVEDRHLLELAKRIHDSKNVVILNADTSSSSAKEFQLEMFSIGKIIKLVTNLSPSLSVFNTLTEEDLLITCSASGNYAIVTRDNVKDRKAYKILVTLNHSKQFQECYHQILFLSDKFSACDYISNGMQNVYTRYGISYFFDLLFNTYIKKYYHDK